MVIVGEKEQNKQIRNTKKQGETLAKFVNITFFEEENDVQEEK